MTGTIRAYAAADKDAVRDVILPIQREEFGVDITYEDQPDLADVPGFYGKGNGGFWVADMDGDVVGTIALIDIGDGQGALRKMFVKAEYRGRTHGIAQHLLEGLIAHARARGMKTILLGTVESYHAAHRFYEKNGFERIEAEGLPASFPRMAVDTRFYRLAL
ncbi:GNAT family N-acetyltransferase [Kordiimonas marina]|uniref:GNAT family N-acetyltransferase n=1 Tax=Kordiimonas marina TaxID=2872312 RepID=UPI001FF45247|nr:GNAT family N-acetyltransferase [Kordiimonas marina]MCJ9429868.1 GNAT family N-acetyltransferase [Kordiimonas marina]